MKQVSKDDIISEVIENYPESIDTFLEYWLWCVWCWIASFETIEEWASAHWLSQEEIEKMINDINDIFDDNK